MTHITLDMLKSLTIAVPPVALQRAIADYLDRETARIDALVAAKHQMLQLLEEQRRSKLERIIWSVEGTPRPAVPLRRLTSRVDVGIAEAATHAYAASGVPLLRSTNIRENMIDDADLLFIEPWFADRNRAKYVLAGDILTVRTGNVGVSALVPERLDRSQCFTQLITTVKPPNSAEFVCLALNSQRTRGYFELSGWGSAQANISVPILGDAPIPMTHPRDQVIATARARVINDRSTSILSTLTAQISLLQERRQALVGAAVTGLVAPEGMDVPEAA